MKFTAQAVLIDDNPDDLKFADRLKRAGLACDAMSVEPTVDGLRQKLHAAIDEGIYNLVIVDYRLDDVANSETAAGYRGGTVAAGLREMFPLCPVVLLTTEDKLRKWLLHKPTVADLFDLQVMKGDLIKLAQRRRIAARLEDLAKGYSILKQRGDGEYTWGTLRDLLNATSAEGDSLITLGEGSGPPQGPEIPSWLLHQLLPFPGLLLDSNELRVRLGLTETAFRKDEVQDLIKELKYQGLFSATLGDRWWRSRLQALLTSLGTTEGAPERSRLIAERTDVRLQPEKCVWCSDSHVRRVCALCSKAVDFRHFLARRVGSRPTWAEPDAVCYLCIATGRADGFQFGPGTESILAGLKSGKIKQDG